MRKIPLKKTRRVLDTKDFSRLWITRDYEKLSNKAQKDFKKKDLTKTALTFGEVNITTYGSELNGVIYNKQSGFIRK